MIPDRRKKVELRKEKKWSWEGKKNELIRLNSIFWKKIGLSRFNPIFEKKLDWADTTHIFEKKVGWAGSIRIRERVQDDQLNSIFWQKIDLK